MNGDWEINSLMQFDHCQNIARAAFGDMLYDDERVNIYKFNFIHFFLTYLPICLFD